MNKLSINSLMIECTRRCNLSCKHCLRGDTQNLNMKPRHISALLKNVDYISSVTFTGGEPLLYPQAIDAFIQSVKEFNVDVGNFYIATNGTRASEDRKSVV